MLVKDILGAAMVYQTLGQNNVEVFTNNKKYKNDLQTVFVDEGHLGQCHGVNRCMGSGHTNNGKYGSVSGESAPGDATYLSDDQNCH